MKYTAINIGPIVSTLGMARKPRELWAASYLFSHLMKCIIEKLMANNADIISPSTEAPSNVGVGLFPDRVFLRGELQENALNDALKQFETTTGLKTETVQHYFNVMCVSVDKDTDAEAVQTLNEKLNYLELFKRTVHKDCINDVRELIGKKYNSKLFEDAFNRKDFPVDTLEDIAKNGLKKEEIKYSYSKYICIVYADGDNMGSLVSQSDKVKDISKTLLEFGKSAKDCIKSYSDYAMPIYAGGDDLLFIAPVCSKGKSILDLLNDIDEKYDSVKQMADKDDIKTSMTYGVSISYHKYPLYEALENARNLLFGKAKKVDGKNAIALEFRKHSGGAFYMEMSKNKSGLKDKFDAIIKASSEKESVISAVSHKIRSNEGLLKLWIEDPNADKSTRNENFFEKYMEYNPSNPDSYKKATLNLMDELCMVESDTEKLVKTMYGMLRIAKFIKGEEVIDE